MKKNMRFLLVGAFIVLLIILFSQTSRTEGFAPSPQQCTSALKNIVAAVDMPYFVQNDPTIFANRIDSAVRNLKSLKCTSTDFDLIDFFQVKNALAKVNDAFKRNNKFCSDNPNKCDMGMKLRNKSINAAANALVPTCVSLIRNTGSKFVGDGIKGKLGTIYNTGAVYCPAGYGFDMTYQKCCVFA